MQVAVLEVNVSSTAVSHSSRNLSKVILMMSWRGYQWSWLVPVSVSGVHVALYSVSWHVDANVTSSRIQWPGYGYKVRRSRQVTGAGGLLEAKVYNKRPDRHKNSREHRVTLDVGWVVYLHTKTNVYNHVKNQIKYIKWFNYHFKCFSFGVDLFIKPCSNAIQQNRHVTFVIFRSKSRYIFFLTDYLSCQPNKRCW